MQIGIVKRSQLLFICSFSLLILAGAALFLLPFAYRGPGDLKFVDALFMAASAVCVTGLSTVAIADFTWFGQLTLLLLTELGGIGIMMLSASILLMLGRGLSFSNTLMISCISGDFSLRGTEGLTKTVLQYVLVTEAAGMVLLFPGFLMQYPFWTALYYSFFHAVTAFCNAGFTPMQNSLTGCNAYVQGVIAVLIAAGGLGVYVIYDFLQAVWTREWKLRIHSKVVLLTSAILILAGTILLHFFGTKNGELLSWWNSLFQSVSARSGGFNTIAMDSLPPTSLTVLIVLMLIGGSPGSTAGGMKTSTVALIFAALYNTFKGNPEVLMFRRTIPTVNILRAFAIMVTFLLLDCAGALFFQAMEAEAGMMECFFESSSAIGTVGLSMGLTGKLSDAGKLFAAFYMFIGRIGPFTAMLFLLGREKSGHLKYPVEQIIIG